MQLGVSSISFLLMLTLTWKLMPTNSVKSITLSPTDLEMAHRWAERRNKGKYQGGSFDNKTPFENHLLGVKGEIGTAKYLRASLDGTHKPDGDNGIDLIYKGCTIDVKSTNHEYPKLIVPDLKKLKADLLVLCTVKEHLVNIHGWMKSEDFRFMCEYLFGVKYPYYYVPCDQLEPINKLIECQKIEFLN